MEKLELFYPVKPLEVLQPFGANKDYYQAKIDPLLMGHPGIDLKAAHGDPVYAAHDGVCFPEIDSKSGNGVVIRTLSACDYNGQNVFFKSIYWHLIKSDAVVKTGQQVKAGDLIGYADSTGVSTGDHLHFGLKPQAWNENDWAWTNTQQTNGFLGNIDSMPFFNGFYAIDSQKVLSLFRQVIALLAAKVAELTKQKK